MFKKDAETLRRYLLIGLIVLVGLVIAILLHRFGPPLVRDVLSFLALMVFPFAFAWIAAIFMRPMARAFSRWLHLPPTLAVWLAILICLAVLAVLVLSIVLVLIGVAGELRHFFSNPENSVTVLFVQLQELYASVDMDFAQVQQWLTQISNAIANLAGQGFGMAVSFIKATPTILLIIIVSLVAMFYFCIDEEAVKRILCTPFPAAKRQTIMDAYDTISTVIGNFLRAQLLLVSIAIVICITWLSIMRMPAALPMGLLAGILDLIPMLGPGTVLIPWGIWLIVTGEIVQGLALIALFATVALVRNIIQPKILGDQVGLHPLVALVSLFIGMELFGAAGLLIGPLAAALLAAWLRYRRNHPPQKA